MRVDLGGTFTKAVAIDMIEGKIIDKVTVPTSHSSSQGVSSGIIQALTALMEKHFTRNSDIEIISHSTTQAVNALLEGDTAKVGIIGMGVGLDRSNIIKRTSIKNSQLASNSYLKTCHRFFDTSKYLDGNEVARNNHCKRSCRHNQAFFHIIQFSIKSRNQLE
jgi:N-methylhydantoinase A